MLKKLLELVKNIERIPGKKFYDLERSLYFLKENLNSHLDCDVLDTCTKACITKAALLKKRHLELLLKGHEIENIFCRIRQENDDFDHVEQHPLENLKLHVEKLHAEAKTATDLLPDCPGYSNYFTLCKLYVFVANGYTNLDNFDKAKDCLEKCQPWICHISECDETDDIEIHAALRREHVAYFHYGWGKFYRDRLSSMTGQEDDLQYEQRSKAIDHFKQCVNEFATIYDKSSLHLEEVILNKLHLVRVYLDIRREDDAGSFDRVPPAEYLELANLTLSDAMVKYDELIEHDREDARQRIEIRITWYKSVLCWRLYQFTENLSRLTTTRVLRNILLQRAEFYVQQAIKKLERTGYNEKSELENYYDLIKTKLPSPISTPRLISTEDREDCAEITELEGHSVLGDNTEPGQAPPVKTQRYCSGISDDCESSMSIATSSSKKSDLH